MLLYIMGCYHTFRAFRIGMKCAKNARFVITARPRRRFSFAKHKLPLSFQRRILSIIQSQTRYLAFKETGSVATIKRLVGGVRSQRVDIALVLKNTYIYIFKLKESHGLPIVRNKWPRWLYVSIFACNLYSSCMAANYYRVSGKSHSNRLRLYFRLRRIY